MLRKSVASKFNLLIVLSVVISVAISSVSITIFLLHRYTEDVIEKDRLHMKGLGSSVKGFIDHAFSLNYLLSINPEIVEHVAAAPKDWSERVAEYNRQYETSLEFKDNSGLPLLVNTQKRYDFVELFFVQDKSGHHQTKEVKLEWDQRVSRIVSDALSGSSGMAENVRLEGKDSTIYYEPIRLPGKDSHDHYSLLLIRDNSSLTKAKLTIIAFVLLFIALALVIFIFFFRIQFRKIVLKPLGTLADSMKDAQIANHEDVELGTHDEFQLMGDTYNQMRQSLVHASEKLTEINERLEQLVDERTAELRRVNQELLQDIAKREQIEKALQQSEERYRSLVENTLDGYFICQIPSGKFLFLNRRICSLAGYTMEQGKNLTVWEVIDPAVHDQIAGLIQDRLNGKFMKFDRRIYTLIRKDGSVFRAEVSTSLVTFQGQTAVQGVLRDITEQERLQEQLQKAERMQSIGTLAGGIAHDFNNLLMGIQGRTSLMLLDVDNSHPFHGQLKGIEDHVKRAADLTNKLLGTAMGGKYQVAPVDLNRLIQENISMFARTKKELSINLKFQEKIWSAAVDRSQIDQVLLNLYVNAWQAMPGGGRLYIQTQNCKLDDKFVKPFHVEPGKYIEISITDTGVGMDGETRKRIFDPFFTTKERGRGTGLGLASAYGIIKNHEGIITVRSEKGKGTTFTIYLPISDIPVREVRIAPEEQLFGAGTILLIDDEEMILDVGKALLQKLGYQVLVAASGRKGLEIYRQNPAKIDLIILDMIMPEMNGGETYERLREIDPRVKVLLSSGYTMDGVANDILKQGPHYFIQKPFDIKKLSRKVRKALQNPEPEN